MGSASEEWLVRVAARNEIEMAKELREGRAVALSASARQGLADGSARAGREVAR